MANKMLIDAIHPEETRVVVLRGNRVEEFDFESANRKQLRGNIYLAKVTRVEPSLQAAFVDYGGNRHGFLAFSEIHPDYYQIPVADRQALLEEDARAHRDDEEDEDRRGGRRNRNRNRGARRHERDVVKSDEVSAEAQASEIPADDAARAAIDEAAEQQEQDRDESPREDDREEQHDTDAQAEAQVEAQVEELTSVAASDSVDGAGSEAERQAPTGEGENGDAAAATPSEARGVTEDAPQEEEVVEDVGGDSDALEEMPVRAPRYRRQYKIQEVIKRRQVMLVQVVKEERGTKGAALTTYLSLAGRYSVLMPNTARGGGISRKVTNSEDRRRMKEIAEALQVPEGMGVILRTAGANRSDQEVQRDFEYLLRMWETVRDLTLKSTAPCLVYEEGSLIKRSIRDLYHKDIDEIIVEGETAHTEAREFMRMLMPSHVGNVQLYRDPLPLFTRYGIETQLDAMFSPTVQLKSGGYIVINQTEALVAIDVNSGRSTREHSIEETALKTNSEASAEVARQLRLRDLAGLIVIDYIDMDEKRNNRVVERKLKDALKSDRARIQIGRISHFGLMEMSRQRLRTSVLESSTESCPHCGGTGHVRSVSSVALQLLRSIDETLMKGATHNLIVRTRSDVAIYVLNHKRAHLRRLEERFKVTITITADATMTGQPPYAIDRGEQVMSTDQARALAAQFEADMPPAPEREVVADQIDETDEMESAEQPEYGQRERPEGAGRRRRGRRGRGRDRDRERGPRDQGHPVPEAGAAAESAEELGDITDDADADQGEALDRSEAGAAQDGESQQENGDRKRRRRGRRGGRRNRRHREGNGNVAEGHVSEGNVSEVMGDDEGQPYQRDGADDMSSDGRESAVTDAPQPRQEPRAEPAYAASAPEPAPESAAAARRRSTVREPAPGFGSASADTPPPAPPTSPPPAAEPAAEANSEEAPKPRRSGWWSRRG
jgi:ribonuclease E